MTASVAGADWFRAAPTGKVMAALLAAAPDGARFVGGCVRNTVMDRPVDDIDIATVLMPDDTVSALEAAGIRAIPTGKEHGTITAICNGSSFEITTLRRDIETDGRHAVVGFTTDWETDARRRDFRLNALYADPDGTIIAPVAGSLDDAKAGRVIFIGDPDARLAEDWLRILRFFRFNAWYGAQVDADGLSACSRAASNLGLISAERVWKELSRLLTAPDPSASVEAMQISGVEHIILSQGTRSTKTLTALISLERALDFAPDPVRRLMALHARSTLDAAALAKRLRLSGADRDRLVLWTADETVLTCAMLDDAARQALYWLSPQTGLDRVLLAAADSETPDDWHALVRLARDWQRPVFRLTGQDLQEEGFAPGPALGAELRKRERDWVASGFST